MKALGWFAPPHVRTSTATTHRGDREAGRADPLVPAGCHQHLHYSVSKDTEHDEVYQSTEEMFGASDLKAFQEWCSSQRANEVSVLRRQFSADVPWVLSRVA